MEIDFLEFLSASNDPNTHKKRREFLSQNLTKRGNMDLYQNICGPKLKKIRNILNRSRTCNHAIWNLEAFRRLAFKLNVQMISNSGWKTR